MLHDLTDLSRKNICPFKFSECLIKEGDKSLLLSYIQNDKFWPRLYFKIVSLNFLILEKI